MPSSGTLAAVRRLRQSNGWIFTTMLISALISLTASFVLSVDAVVLAADPQAALSCNINAVLSCGTVGTSWQASLFGFPNSFLGLVAEPVDVRRSRGEADEGADHRLERLLPVRGLDCA